MPPRRLLVCLLLQLPAAPAMAQAPWAPWLADSLALRTARPGVTIAVAVADPRTGAATGVRRAERFHAASTMKVPIAVALARQVEAGTLRWDEPVPVRNRFASLVDGSPFTLDPADDSDSTLYDSIGRDRPLLDLARRMIARSSNLATNLLLERVGAAAVQALVDALGAGGLEVRRGVEDTKAFRAGRNNTTTAGALAALLASIEAGRAAGPAATDTVRALLLAQEFNDALPAGLPAGTRIAHKTGEISGITHDAGIVYPPGRAPYVVVVLTRGFATRAEGAAAIADLSALVWRAVTGRT
ncbi:MAG: serine hydrolase [Gemmatimonadales bacterium]|nr:serine hydrolase [Gemmatimonadales bacterium]